VTDACTDCGTCWGTCPLGLIDDGTQRRAQAECTACMRCPRVCPEAAIGFAWGYTRVEAPLDVDRRRLIGSAAAGLALVPLTRIHPARAVVPPNRLRPPGSRAEADFLNRCLRCGACMKVCMRNAIHPALHEAGWEGVFTPIMDFEIGYCEYNCTLCGQVCPSEAIRRLPLETPGGRPFGDGHVAVAVQLADGRNDLVIAADAENVMLAALPSCGADRRRCSTCRDARARWWTSRRSGSPRAPRPRSSEARRAGR
jgi:ferredoxin